LRWIYPMLATFKRAIGGDRNPAGEKLTDRKKIIAILRHLKADHELLSVTVPGCKDKSNTAILGTREEHDHFYLDELNSQPAHEAFLKSRKARIDCRLQGMELSFVVHMLRANTTSPFRLRSPTLKAKRSEAKPRTCQPVAWAYSCTPVTFPAVARSCTVFLSRYPAPAPSWPT